MQKENLKPCDVIFTFEKKNIVSKLIWFFSTLGRSKKFDREKISHSIFYLGGGEILEAIAKGVKISNIDKYIDKKKYNVKAKRCIENIPIGSMAGYATTLVDKYKYAFFQILIILVKKLFRIKVNDVDSKKVQCAELVEMIYRKFGVKLVPRLKACNVSPLDQYNSKKLELVE